MESCALIFNWEYKMAFNDHEKAALKHVQQ